MVGTIAQLVSLVSHGNEAIYSGRIDEDYINNSTFKFCNSIKFIKLLTAKLTTKSLSRTSAANANLWFELLIKENCRRLKLFYLPPRNADKVKPHMTAGFIGGGGSWLIEATYDDRTDYWTNKWKIKNKKAPDRKIWNVIFVKIDFHVVLKHKQEDLEKLRDEFRDLLEELTVFAMDKRLSSWSKKFDLAKRTLDSRAPSENYGIKDMLVTVNYSLPVQQLLYTAAMAWAFGGMGSWNDVGFNDEEDKKIYDRLTEDLFKMICRAILVAANSY